MPGASPHGELIPLTLAHSADADDVFMWWPITGRVDPRAPGTLLSPPPQPAIDTGRFGYTAVPEDIQALNARAVATGDLDITAISMFTYPAVQDRYALTCCGWSLGDGFGPKLVVREGTGADLDRLRKAGARIAVPGVQTTAFLVLTLLLGRNGFVPVPMRFDQIAAAVSRGEVDAGVLIHESQIDFERLGLRALEDLGRWWKETTGLPLPLGANVVRRDCEQRFGPGTLAEIEATLTASIRHALAHRAAGLAYARTFSPPISDADLDRYVSMYVSPLTVDAGEAGREAVVRLLAEAHGAGLCKPVGRIAFAGET
ncbi:MAG: menaquinone biosynthesis family protein [Phycisphaerales bacterium]